MIPPAVAWIYDLDGVVTHLTEKKITNPQLLTVFAKQLQNNEPVTLNTGRSLSFIREKVLTPLLQHLNEHNLSESLLHNFFAVGEKGNAWIKDEKDAFDTSTAVPEDFAKKVQSLVAMDFSDTMFFDTTKKTMISLEMRTGLDTDKFTPARDILVPILQDMLISHGLAGAFKIDPNISSVDIEAKSAGKGKGMQRILDWLSERKLNPEKFVAFGDSLADLGMGEALQHADKNFTFVFVGEQNLITKLPDFPITYTKEKYDQGVVEYIVS